MHFIIILLFIYICVCLLYEPYVENRRNHKWNLFFISSVLVVICTFRPIDMKDAQNYINDYLLVGFESRFEVGYQLLADTCRHIIGDYHFLFFTVAAFSVFIKLKAINCISLSVYGSLCVYVSNFFVLHEMIQIRAGIASGLVLWAIKYAIERKGLKFLCICALALTFHQTALIFFPLWYIVRVHANRYVLLSVIPLCYLLYFSGFSLGHLAANIPNEDFQRLWKAYELEMAKGIGTDINLFNVLMLIRIAICSFLIFNIDLVKSKFPDVDCWIAVYILSLMIFILMSDVPVVAFRLSEMFQIVEVIIFPLLIYAFRPKLLAMVVLILFMIPFLISTIMLNFS